MIQTVEIHADLDPLPTGGSNPTGKLFLKLNDYYFPEKGWNDLVLAVLGNWLVEADQLDKGKVRNGTFHFMDGPLKFTIAKNRDKFDIEFLHFNRVIHSDQRLEWHQFLIELKVKSNQLVEEYFKKNNRTSSDIELISSYTGFRS